MADKQNRRVAHNNDVTGVNANWWFACRRYIRRSFPARFLFLFSNEVMWGDRCPQLYRVWSLYIIYYIYLQWSIADPSCTNHDILITRLVNYRHAYTHHAYMWECVGVMGVWVYVHRSCVIDYRNLYSENKSCNNNNTTT